MANPDQNTQEPDLRASLEAAFEEPTEQVEPPDMEREAVRAPQTDTKPRDEKGKFVKPSEVVTDETQQPEQVESVAPVEKPALRAPSSWKPDAQAVFNELPAHVQEEVLRRESDYHKGIEGYKTHAQAAQAFEKAVAPYMATIQSLGVDAPTAVSKLLAADHTLRYGDPGTKAQFFAKLAQQYGVDLSQIANPGEVDPRISNLQQQIAQLNANLRAKDEQEAQREQGSAQAELQRFAADPKNTHFDAVRDEMALLLESGRASTLQEAYDTAVWMRGDIRKSLIEQQRAESQHEATEAARAQKAKAASASVKGSSPAAAGIPPVKGSLREQLEAAFADS